MGKFCWMSIDQPEAFSLLACYHLAANSTTAIQLSGKEAVSMYLRSTEGMGLNESDMQKATKVVLHAPTDVDTSAKQLGVFGTLCGAIFGKKSDLLLEMDDWITHIAKNEATYRNMQHFNPMFALQLACFIDRKVQLYLRGCSDVHSPNDMPSTILSFARAKMDIMEGSFTNNLVPRTLSDQLRKTRHKPGPSITGDSSSDDEPAPRNCKRRQQKQGKGCKVVNDNPVHKWLVEQPAIGFFVKRVVQNGPLWGHRRICFHYHSTGECTDDCYFHNTHGEFPEKISKAYASWFTRTMKAWKQNNRNDREDDDDAESTNAPAPKRACNNNDD